MRILIVNDDGLDSPGLKALADALAPTNEISVISTLSQKSAAGHGISLRGISYKKFPNDYGGITVGIEGTPADCVKAGILHFLKDSLPDLVIAGINEGPNVGAETLYSATVSCALEASYLKVKSLAVSNFNASFMEGYGLAAAFIRDNLDKLISLIPGPYSSLNINYPPEKAKGVKFCRAAMNYYTDHYVEGPEGTLRLVGEPIPSTAEEGTDLLLCLGGYITIVPVRLDKNHDGFDFGTKAELKF